MKEQRIKIKEDYENYLIMFKSGNFYISLNNDAFIMNNIFNYKIIVISNYIKIGFPINSLNKVSTKLDELKINYIIYDKAIIQKIKFAPNNYKKFVKENNYLVYLNRISKINYLLKNNIKNSNMDKILNKIENILCTINY